MKSGQEQKARQFFTSAVLGHSRRTNLSWNFRKATPILSMNLVRNFDRRMDAGPIRKSGRGLSKSLIRRCCFIAAIVAILGFSPSRKSAFAAAGSQLNQNCTATIANRSVQVNPDGTYAIPNIPTDVGFYRVRVVCKNADGTITHGQSPFVTFVANGSTDIPGIVFGTVTPAPVSIAISALSTSFTTLGQTSQLTVTGTLPDGTTTDLSTRALGTLYITSNPRIATVSADGLITAVSHGVAIITSRNEG